MHRRLAATLFLAPLALCAAARADDRHLVILGGGFYDLEMPTDSVDRAAAYNLELRLRPGLWHFHPHGGFQGTSDGTVYGYAGVHLDFPVGEHLRLVPSGSIGLYGQGENDKDLGGLMQFRIGGGMAWRFDNDWRLGLSWYHMSNAGVYDLNPGVEMMFLELGIPLP
jgi:hypothetical protein